MVRARIFLALAFLAATFVAATMVPDTGNAASHVGCADFVCADVAAGDACPGCKGKDDRSGKTGASTCAAVCAAMSAMPPSALQAGPAAPPSIHRLARPAPSGNPVAPERSPPRHSILA